MFSPQASKTFLDKIKKLLLIDKDDSAKMVDTLLSVLGLFRVDFAQKETIHAVCDADGITIMAEAFSPSCTCPPNDELVYRIEDGTMHSGRCHLEMDYTLKQHPCLISSSVKTGSSIWEFSWPKDIVSCRKTLQTRFQELAHDAMWKAFEASWAEIMKVLPETKLPERKEVVIIGGEPVVILPDEEIPEAPPKPSYEDDLSFDEPTASVADNHEEPSKEEPPAPEKTSEAVVAPAIPAVPEKAKRGRKFGSTVIAKKIKEAEKNELPPEAFVPAQSPEAETAVISIPACKHFADLIRENCARFQAVAEEIEKAEKFPVEIIRQFKVECDRLSLRAAHLEYHGHDDGDNAPPINLLVEATLANVTATVTTAIRDLGLAPELPRSWETFGKSIKEAQGLAGSLCDVMAQPGAGPAIQEANPSAS